MGDIQWVAADNGEEFPEAQQLVELLKETFERQSGRGAFRAVGICYDGRVIPPGESEKSDAICCSLEHIGGEAVDMFVPYRKKEAGLSMGRYSVGNASLSSSFRKALNSALDY
jgi:hypothetical protein